ncbi:MAG TPA: hypothetical protein PK299_13250, partial [Anaerolineales bacterium]|nr:hypothetical protein [Anaerolineales bacterium]
GYPCSGSTWKKTDYTSTGNGNSKEETGTSAEPDETLGGGEGAGEIPDWTPSEDPLQASIDCSINPSHCYTPPDVPEYYWNPATPQTSQNTSSGENAFVPDGFVIAGGGDVDIQPVGYDGSLDFVCVQGDCALMGGHGPGATAGVGGNFLAGGGVVWNADEPADYLGESLNISITGSILAKGFSVTYARSATNFWDFWNGNDPTQALVFQYAPGADISFTVSMMQYDQLLPRSR